MLLERLTNLIYKLLMMIFIVGFISTTIYYFSLRFAYKGKQKSKIANSKGNKCSQKSNISKIIVINEKSSINNPKNIITIENKEIKELKKQASELISSNMKAEKFKRDDILALSKFITKITGNEKSENYKNDLHFIYSSLKYEEISQKNLAKIILFVKNGDSIN